MGCVVRVAESVVCAIVASALRGTVADVTIMTPVGVEFADLRLERDDAGVLHYALDALAACCLANGLDVGMTLGDADVSCCLT